MSSVNKLKTLKSTIKKLRNSNLKEDIIQVAEAHQGLGQWEEAMNCWNQLLTAEPENAQYYNYRGVCKFQLRFAKAVLDFNKAIELDPNNPYHYACRAYIKDKTGDTEGAVDDYQKAFDLDPADAITLNNLGLAEQKLGHTKSARERFKYSDDLLGIKTIDSREPEITQNIPPKSTIWQEFKAMISSKEGFRQFLKDAGLIK